MLRIEINMICLKIKKNCWLRLVNYQKVTTCHERMLFL